MDEQQGAPPTGERIGRLESAMHYEREMRNAALALHWHQMQAYVDGQVTQLRHEMRLRGFGEPLGLAGWMKLAAALLLPFLAFLLTGSLEQAATVAKVMGSP